MGLRAASWLPPTTRSRPTCSTSGWCTTGPGACTTRSGSWPTCSCRGLRSTCSRGCWRQQRDRQFPADLNAELSAADGPARRWATTNRWCAATCSTSSSPRTGRPSRTNRGSRTTIFAKCFAETKIVNGLGEPEQWYSLLPPEKYQALKDRVDLDFASTNRRYFAADEPVQLDVLRQERPHADRQSLRDQHHGLLSAATAGGQFRHQSRRFGGQRRADVPVRRSAAAACRRGISSFRARPSRASTSSTSSATASAAGRSSAKGSCSTSCATSTAGHVFTIFDEQQQARARRHAVVGGPRVSSRRAGTDRGPVYDQARPATDRVVARRFLVARSRSSTRPRTTSWSPASTWIANRCCRAKRPKSWFARALYSTAAPSRSRVLEDIRLHDHLHGSRRHVDGERSRGLQAVRGSRIDVRVPDAAATGAIQFTLQAKVQSLSQNKKLDLARERSVRAERDRQDRQDRRPAFWPRSRDEYCFEMRGKTGEAKPDRPVQLSLKHRDFTEPVSVVLQSDDGRAASTRAADRHRRRDGHAARRHGPTPGSCRTDRHTYPGTLARRGGRRRWKFPIWARRKELAARKLSLLELRGDTFVQDRFDALAFDRRHAAHPGTARGETMTCCCAKRAIGSVSAWRRGRSNDGLRAGTGSATRTAGEQAAADRWSGRRRGHVARAAAERLEIRSSARVRDALLPALLALRATGPRRPAEPYRLPASRSLRRSTSRAATSATSIATSSTASMRQKYPGQHAGTAQPAAQSVGRARAPRRRGRRRAEGEAFWSAGGAASTAPMRPTPQRAAARGPGRLRQSRFPVRSLGRAPEPRSGRAGRGHHSA